MFTLEMALSCSPRLACNYSFQNPQATTAYALKKAFPEITLNIVPDAGHSSRESGIAKLLVEVRLSLNQCRGESRMRKLPTGNRLVCRYLKCSGRRNGNEY